MIGEILGQWTYLVTTVAISALIILGVEIFHKHTLREEWHIFAFIAAIGLIQGVPMSHFSIAMDAYKFGQEYILGKMIIISPIEDVVFAIAVPAFIAAVTIYFYNHPPQNEDTLRNRIKRKLENEI